MTLWLRPVRVSASILISILFALHSAALGQRLGVPVPPLGDGPFLFDTAEQHNLRVTVVARGLEHPWSLAFLPDGSILVTERPGRLRIVRNGVLEPNPISGVPAVMAGEFGGFQDVALHPQFDANHLVYFTYSKRLDNGWGASAIGRGRLEGNALYDVRDVFVTEGRAGPSGLSGRVVFARDGNLFMSTEGIVGNVAQDPMSLRGKILRLRDDGSVPPDNPFAGRSDYRPEIFSLGHRNILGLIIHPETGALWNNENGPNGGDEINIILPGRNYGWPVITFGRDYSGRRLSEHPVKEGMEPPLVVWLPSIAVSGMAVYTGDRFPKWKGNVFVGSMTTGQFAATGHLERIVFNQKAEELQRESILGELRQRIREVRLGPDGYLYLLTDQKDGAILRIEPWP